MNAAPLEKEIRTAIKRGDLARTMELLGSDTKRLRMLTVFGTWLHVAADLGQLDILKELIARGADIEASGGVYGGTALNEAASEGRYDVVKFLIASGARLNVEASERNPLFSAITGGHEDVAKLLIDSGIDTTVKYTGENLKGVDALAYARRLGQVNIENMLIEHQESSREHSERRTH